MFLLSGTRDALVLSGNPPGVIRNPSMIPMTPPGFSLAPSWRIWPPKTRPRRARHFLGAILLILVHLGAQDAPEVSWELFCCWWCSLGALSPHLSPTWGHLGLSWGYFGPTWRHLGSTWGHSTKSTDAICNQVNVSKIQSTQNANNILNSQYWFFPRRVFHEYVGS